jgi:hypothetical protein
VTIIESRGVRHRTEFRVDHVLNQPTIVHDVAPSPVVVGTKVMVQWPAKITIRHADLLLSSGHRFQALVEAYAGSTRI